MVTPTNNQTPPPPPPMVDRPVERQNNNGQFAQFLGQLAQSAIGMGGSAFGVPGIGSFGSGDASFERSMWLIERQREVNMESQMFQMRSNIDKAEHDARMAAVRNMKP